MKFYKYSIFLLFITAACNSPRAVYDYDDTAEFSRITTYKIYPELVSNVNQLDEQRLLRIISEELSEEGLTTSENPDILVNFYASEFQTPSRNTLGVGVGGGGGNVGVGVSGGMPIGGPDTYLKLTIDFIDSQKDSLLWQAVVEGKVNKNASPEKRESQLRKMVEEALEGYPPKRKR